MSVLRSIGTLHRQLFLTFTKVPTAKYASHPVKFTEVEDRWREKDGVSKRWQLIYKAPLDNALNYLTTYVTVSTSVIACTGVYYAFHYNPSDLEKPILLGEDVVLANSPFEGLIYVGTFIALHIALKVLLSRFVIRIYQDGDQYLAVFRKHMYNSIGTHEFHLKEFKRLKPPLVVSWGDARFALGKKHAIILENYFKTPQYFNYLLYKRKPVEN